MTRKDSQKLRTLLLLSVCGAARAGGWCCPDHDSARAQRRTSARARARAYTHTHTHTHTDASQVTHVQHQSPAAETLHMPMFV